MTLKQKILKTIYYLTFLPYIYVLLMTAWGYFIGFSFFFGVADGTNALYLVLVFCIYLSPLLLGCLLYQIAFKVLTRGKSEYKRYNTKKFVLVTLVIIIVYIAGSIAIAYVKDVHEEYKYNSKFYGSSYVACIPYDDSLYSLLDTRQFMTHNALLKFLDNNEELKERFYGEFAKFKTSYLVLVSPKLDGVACDIQNVEIRSSEGLQEATVTIEYSVNRKVTGDYVMVAVLTAGEFKGYNLTCEWKEV